MKGLAFLLLLFVGLGTISHFTGSSAEYVSRVGELEMPSAMGSWLMLAWIVLLVLIFRSNDTRSDKTDAKTTSVAKREEWPADDDEDQAGEYPDYYDPENWKKP